MGTGDVNRLLGASALCTLWGLAGVVVETVSEGIVITPRGLPGATLLMIGLLTGAVGQLLFRQAVKIEALERRLRDRSNPAEPLS
jgi:hypothetical protein